MKFLLTAINAKYIHSNPGVYSLKMFAESQGAAEAVQGDQDPREDGLPCAPFVEIAEYTINNQMELILEDIYLNIGEKEYLERWVEHPFPKKSYLKLFRL